MNLVFEPQAHFIHSIQEKHRCERLIQNTDLILNEALQFSEFVLLLVSGSHLPHIEVHLVAVKGKGKPLVVESSHLFTDLLSEQRPIRQL